LGTLQQLHSLQQLHFWVSGCQQMCTLQVLSQTRSSYLLGLQDMVLYVTSAVFVVLLLHAGC
jgi:hypothetical protein